MCKQSATIDDMIDHLDQRQRKITQSLSLLRIAARSAGGMNPHVENKSIESRLDQSMTAGKMLSADTMR